MDAVLMSIRPKWCELIANGKKTVEVRKTKPKLKTPFKVYIYCSEKDYDKTFCIDKFMHKVFLDGNGKQKVIGKFVCDEIFTIRYVCGSYRCEGLAPLENDRVAAASQLSLYDMRNYLACNDGYAWHISNLVIYDEPKDLSEFTRVCDGNCYKCKDAIWRTPRDFSSDSKIVGCGRKVTTPQSWCYVEELRGD